MAAHAVPKLVVGLPFPVTGPSGPWVPRLRPPQFATLTAYVLCRRMPRWVGLLHLLELQAVVSATCISVGFIGRTAGPYMIEPGLLLTLVVCVVVLYYSGQASLLFSAISTCLVYICSAQLPLCCS